MSSTASPELAIRFLRMDSGGDLFDGGDDELIESVLSFKELFLMSLVEMAGDELMFDWDLLRLLLSVAVVIRLFLLLIMLTSLLLELLLKSDVN